MTSYTLSGARPDDDEDRRRRLGWLRFAVIAVLVAGLIVLIARLNGCNGNTCGAAGAGHGAPNVTGNATSSNPHDAASSSVSIVVSGRETGRLTPGVTRPLAVSVVNTGGRRTHITSASVSVGDPSRACTATSSIRVTRYDASSPGALSYLLAPGATVTIPLSITMLDLPSNQNACRNASFPLTFHATAQQG